MHRGELITILESGLNDSDLHEGILATLSILREDKSASISGNLEGSSANKNSILATYRRRQKHLKKRGEALLGFDGTISSLSKCDSERINLVTVKAGNQLIGIWLTPSKKIVGCDIGKDNRDDEE